VPSVPRRAGARPSGH